MAIDAINVGTFIPNAAGLPESLSDSPAEASVKSAKVVTPVADAAAQDGDGAGSGGGGQDAGVDVEA